MRARSFYGCSIVVLALASCTDEGEGDTSTSTGSGLAGTGGTGAGASGGGGNTPSGGGGQGGQGGGAVTCLPASESAPFFTLERTDFCVVEKLTAAGLDLPGYGTTPTWGAHDGPLTFEPTENGVRVSRWSETQAGVLTAVATDVTVPGVPADAFWGTTAVDVSAPMGDACPDEGVLVLGWTGADFQNDGALVRIANGAATSQLAAGLFGLAARGERLFFTGLSEVGGPTDGTLALYAADAQPACENPAFASGGAIDAWGLATGPVAFDPSGNLFAIMTDFGTGTQEIRGFPAGAIDAGDPPVEGTPMATLDGYGDALAAVAPAGGQPGLIVLQPNANDGSHEEIMSVAYDITQEGLSAGATAPFATVTVDDDNAVLFIDPLGRLWMGFSRGGPDDPVATFFVLDRAPAGT